MMKRGPDWALGSSEKLGDAMAFCQQALQLDPNNVLALDCDSYVKFMRPILFGQSVADPVADIRRADGLLARAGHRPEFLYCPSLEG
jgi:hypothetical protein